jgi:Uma2 family endonuclease
MAMFIENPTLEEELKAQRQAWGADGHDEVWEGVYFMSPMADNEHQRIALRIARVLEAAIGDSGIGSVYPGVNLAASAENWEDDYRVPDVVVFLADTAAEDHGVFWTGAADFVVEITSPRDRTYEKSPFYSRLGVREVLVLNRQKWALELYRHRDGELQTVGESMLARPDVLSSEVLPLDFRLVPGEARSQVEVRHKSSGEQWVV